MSSPFDSAFFNQIGNIKNTFILSLASVLLLVDDEALKILEAKKSVSLGKVRFPPKEIATYIRNVKLKSDDDLQILTGNYFLLLVSSTIHRSL